MLCVCWDYKGIVHWELLNYGQTVNSDLYCNQLDRLKEVLIQNRPELVNRKGVILLHDYAKPHTSKKTRQKIKELEYEVLSNPTFRPDIAPSDYHLFRSLQMFLRGKTFKYMDDIKLGLVSYFASKSSDFFREGIGKLMKRCQIVVDNYGEYIID